MSDERVRALLREIERELAGTGRTLTDVIQDGLNPFLEGVRLLRLIDMNYSGPAGPSLCRVMDNLVNSIHRGLSAEAALIGAIQALATLLREAVGPQARGGTCERCGSSPAPLGLCVACATRTPDAELRRRLGVTTPSFGVTARPGSGPVRYSAGTADHDTLADYEGPGSGQ